MLMCSHCQWIVEAVHNVHPPTAVATALQALPAPRHRSTVKLTYALPDDRAPILPELPSVSDPKRDSLFHWGAGHPVGGAARRERAGAAAVLCCALPGACPGLRGAPAAGDLCPPLHPLRSLHPPGSQGAGQTSPCRTPPSCYPSAASPAPGISTRFAAQKQQRLCWQGPSCTCSLPNGSSGGCHAGPPSTPRCCQTCLLAPAPLISFVSPLSQSAHTHPSGVCNTCCTPGSLRLVLPQPTHCLPAIDTPICLAALVATFKANSSTPLPNMTPLPALHAPRLSWQRARAKPPLQTLLVTGALWATTSDAVTPALISGCW